jgi:hypothetical protein
MKFTPEILAEIIGQYEKYHMSAHGKLDGSIIALATDNHIIMDDNGNFTVTDNNLDGFITNKYTLETIFYYHDTTQTFEDVLINIFERYWNEIGYLAKTIRERILFEIL